MRLFKFALPVLFIAGVALFATRAWQETEDAAKRQLAAEHARAQFVQRAAVVRGADDAHYSDELHNLLRAWYAEQADLGNRWPAQRGQPGPFVPPAPKVKGGDMHEYEELANKSIGAWREGKLELMTGGAAGSLHFDILRIVRTTGQPRLAVDLAVWGAPEELEVEESKDGRQVQHASVPLFFKGLGIKFFDEKGKEIAGMPIEGEPSLRLDMPERLVHDAPPGVVIARYEPGLFPRDAVEVGWTLTATLRTTTGELRPLKYEFRTKVDPSWVIAAGEAWGGKELTASGR